MFEVAKRSFGWAAAAGLVAAFGVVAWGCGSALHGPASYSYFEAPDPSDPWSPKIAGWQWRARTSAAEGRRVTAAADSESEAAPPAEDAAKALREKYREFRTFQKREVARQLAHWIQGQAPLHYVEDGPIDHWATLEETLRHDGDDCDGLELLAYNLLLDTGFADDEVYRAIVYRPSDGQHHMVTLWFVDPRDPWVIDPTGAMARGMPRMSDLPVWVPLKIFGERAEFSVRRKPYRASSTRESGGATPSTSQAP